MAPRLVYLVRHGDTVANETTAGPTRERGWKPYPLDPAGRKEARQIAVKLGRRGIKGLVSSDLERAKETADIIGDWLGITPAFHTQLRTWNTGDLAGKLKSEAEPVIARAVRFTPDEALPGGESFENFARRIFAALSDILATHSESPLAVIIHQRIERLIAGWKAAGAKRTHEIDADVFLQKGELPGHIEACQLNTSLLKLSHEEVGFGPAKKKGDRCRGCKAYGGQNNCTKVVRPIGDDDWCAVGVSKATGRWFCPVGNE